MLSIQRHPLRLTLGIDSRLRTTERGSNTEISATNSRYRTCEGVAPLASPRRVHYKRRAGCLQPENSGPFVLATAPIFLDPCSPGSSLLCLGNRIPSNQSLTRQSPVPPRRSTTSSCPPRNGRAVLRKEKWVWRLETCDDALCLGTAPHGCRSGWTSCKRSRLR
jgi:hypothetical protein